MTVPWLVLSPHFDDAVLSCGHLLAAHPGSVVLTICGGIAPRGLPASDWDQAGGFAMAEEATAGRKAEDAAALELLGARQATTDLLDGPYRERAADDLPRALDWTTTVIAEADPERVAIPLGTPDHPDHVLTREAGLAAALRLRPDETYFYADLPYFVGGDPSAVAAAAHAALSVQPAPDADVIGQKAIAVERYASQTPLLTAFFGDRFAAVFAPNAERLYLIAAR